MDVDILIVVVKNLQSFQSVVKNISHILSANALLGLPAAPGPVGAVYVSVHGVIVVAQGVDPETWAG